VGDLADVAALKYRLQMESGFMTVPPCLCHHLRVDVVVALMSMEAR
jgi:hypothetical protein